MFEQKNVNFVHITSSSEGTLYGLDESGKVWKYVPALSRRDKTQFAFWTRLTDFAKDGTKKGD